MMVAIIGYGILFFIFGTYVGVNFGMFYLEWKLRKELKKQNVELDIVWKETWFKKLCFDELNKDETK